MLRSAMTENNRKEEPAFWSADFFLMNTQQEAKGLETFSVLRRERSCYLNTGKVRDNHDY